MCRTAACSDGMAGSPASAIASAEVATRNGRCEERTDQPAARAPKVFSADIVADTTKDDTCGEWNAWVRVYPIYICIYIYKIGRAHV